MANFAYSSICGKFRPVVFRLNLCRRQFCDGKQTLYDTLGVTSEATPQEIKTSYYTLCKQLHPDTTSGKENVVSSSEDVLKFIEIGEAYEVLGNREKRAEYDRQLYLSKTGKPDIGRDLRNFQEFRSRWRNRATKLDEQMRRDDAAKFRRSYQFDQNDFDRFYALYKKRQSDDANLHWQSQAYNQAQRLAGSEEMVARRRAEYEQFHSSGHSPLSTPGGKNLPGLLYGVLALFVFCTTLGIVLNVKDSRDR